MAFGRKADQHEANSMIDCFLDAGGNFLNTANIYSRGLSEEMTGKALAAGKRTRVFLATTFYRQMDESDPNSWGNHRFNIIKACEDSLRRLNTDHIDLYQIHRPQPSVPIDETLRALDDLIHAGKVRYIGTSTFAAWQLIESLWVSKELHLNRVVNEQPPYNLLERRVERELIPACITYGIGVMPWSPLAEGRLTGKYRRGQPAPPNSRKQPEKFGEGIWSVLEGLEEICRDRGCTMTAFSLAWLSAMPGVTSPIIGPNNVKQLGENLAASAVTITDDDRRRVDQLIAPGTHVEDYYQANFGPHPHRW
jgi:aryl-alcohol dehydrogenase-like predicted oxidoreductase